MSPRARKYAAHLLREARKLPREQRYDFLATKQANLSYAQQGTWLGNGVYYALNHERLAI